MKQHGRTLYWTLFASTFMLSAVTFGGGYVIVPLLKRKFVDELHWIDEQEMLDMVAIAQSSPGPLAVNASIIIGYRMAGVPGALLTALGTVLPPLVIISVISAFYAAFRDNRIVSLVLKGMQAGVQRSLQALSLRWQRVCSGKNACCPCASCSVHSLHQRFSTSMW